MSDTVAVRNILNYILSPKIVSDGNGGYTTKVDLVNIDRIAFESGTGNGTLTTPFTAQCGTFTTTGTTTPRIYHRSVTSNSIILLSVLENGGTAAISGISRADGYFQVNLSRVPTLTATITWFIVKF